MSIIRSDIVPDGMDVSCNVDGNVVIFHFDHTPSNTEINTKIAQYIVNIAPPVETIQLMGEDGIVI